MTRAFRRTFSSLRHHRNYRYFFAGQVVSQTGTWMQRLAQGWFVIQLKDPSQAAGLSQRIDQLFKNSSSPTKTETERAFQAGFVTMWGNVAFLMRDNKKRARTMGSGIS